MTAQSLRVASSEKNPVKQNAALNQLGERVDRMFSEGISLLATPNISTTVIGQSSPNLSTLNVEATSASGTTGQHLVNIGLTSSAGTGDNVALFASATVTGAFDTWAQNLLGTINASSGSQNFIVSEIDLNNFNADRGNTAGPSGLANPVAYGVEISGVSTHKSTAAICVTGASGQWNRGIVFAGGGPVVQASIAEYGSPSATIDVWGSPTNVIDLTNNGGSITDIIKSPQFTVAYTGVTTINPAATNAYLALEANGTGFDAAVVFENGATNAFLGYVPSGGATSGDITAFIGAIRFVITKNGNVVMGNAALATNATDGFFYMDSCAGTPTGTPTSFTGRVPFIYDATNNKIAVFNGGAWKQTAALT